MIAKIEQELNTFIDEWEETANENGNKNSFLHFKNYLTKKNEINLDFVTRPGITYSLRAAHTKQKDNELFVMIDVIEDVSRWLSICFYDNMITDVEERGDFIPGGLMGEDAVCFDLEKYDEAQIRYIEARLDEASSVAAAI